MYSQGEDLMLDPKESPLCMMEKRTGEQHELWLKRPEIAMKYNNIDTTTIMENIHQDPEKQFKSLRLEKFKLKNSGRHINIIATLIGRTCT